MRSIPRLVLLAAVAVAAACADSTPDEDRAMERIISAVDATREEGTSRLSLDVTEAVGSLSGQQRGGGENVERFRAAGVVQFETSDLSMTFDLADAGVPGSDASAEIRQLDGTYYVQVPGTERWLELELDRVGETLGDPSGLRSAIGTSPNALLGLLAGTEQARRIGTEEVRGIEADHYTAAVDVAVAAEEAEGEAKTALSALSEQMAQTALPLEVWLDDDDRVVRLRIPVIVEPSREEPEPPRITTTMEFFDFGTPFEVEVPPEEAIERG